MEKLESQKNIPRILRRLSSIKERPLLQSADSAVKKPLISIIHFNDVYDIQPKGGNRGVCNFKAKVQVLRDEFPQALTLFSGDCLSPSNLTNIKQGWQMVHALNQLKIDCACFGNHQFDFDDIFHTVKLTKACNFPWLLGNITFKNTGKLLGQGQPYHIIIKAGIKIGIFGVAGSDWMGILNDTYQDLLDYQSCFDFGTRTAKYLRETLQCDIVIALTHMRNAADKEFPLRVQGVDLCLGGHDHVIMQEIINNTLIIKSGSNFNNVGLIHLYAKDQQTQYQGKRFNYQWTIFKVPEAQKVDQELKKYIDDLMDEYKKFDEVVGYTSVALQTRFTKIRKQESNYGNFLADLARLYYDCDVTAINAGMVRNDALIGPGKLTYSKISNIIDSPLIVKQLKGSTILKMLQLSVSSYPDFTGQFLFISGITFSFDYQKEPRVQQVKIAGNPLDDYKFYTLCTTLYQARGGDGFSMLKQGQVIIDQVKGTSMLHLLLKFFKAADTHQEYESIKVLAQHLSQDSNELSQQDLPQFPLDHLILVKKVSVRMGRIKDLRNGFVLSQDGKKLTSIGPTEEGRIACINKA